MELVKEFLMWLGAIASVFYLIIAICLLVKWMVNKFTARDLQVTGARGQWETRE